MINQVNKERFLILMNTQSCEKCGSEGASPGFLKQFFYNIMLQQIYRRPPCRSVISIKMCSNIIETAHLLRGCLL